MKCGFGHLIARLLVLVILAASPLLHVQAADKDSQPPAGAGSIDANTGKILSEAIEFLNQENFAAARQTMSKLKMDKLSPYELSRTYQILASIDQSQENYGSARTNLQKAIDAGGLAEIEISQVRYQIAQMFLAQEKWREGAAALEQWFRSAPNPNSAAYYLLAVAYYQMEAYDKALVPAKKAVEMAEKPQEGWVQLVVALYLQKEQYRNALPYLEKLLATAPEKKTYWSQLSSVYGQLEDYRKSLAVLQLAYDAGLIVEDGEIRRLADLQMYNELPYRCGMLIDDALKKNQLKSDSRLYEKQANCWIAAREFDKSISPLSRAAELSDNGNLMVRLGEVQVQRSDWAGAADAFQKALRKGGLRDTGNAQLMMGIALFNQKKLKDARTWFERVKGHAKHGRMARGYLQLIQAQS